MLVIAQYTYKCINIECGIKTQIIGFGRKHPRGKNKVSQKITPPSLNIQKKLMYKARDVSNAKGMI